MHESGRAALAAAPAKAAAYDLLFGVDETRFRGNGNRFTRFPLEVALALPDLLYLTPETLAAAHPLRSRENLAFASAAGLLGGGSGD